MTYQHHRCLVERLPGEGGHVVNVGEGGGQGQRLKREGSNFLHCGHHLVGEVGLHAQTVGEAIGKSTVEAVDKSIGLDKATVEAIHKSVALDKAIVKAIHKYVALD